MKITNLTCVKLAAGALAILAGVNPASAQSADALINKLVQKGILTEQEAKDIQAETAKETSEAKTSPFVLPLGKESKLKIGGFIQGNGEFGDVSAFEGRFADGPNAIHD